MNRKKTKELAQALGLEVRHGYGRGSYRGFLVALTAYKECVVFTVAGRALAQDTADIVEKIQKQLLEEGAVTKCIYERYAIRIAMENDSVEAVKAVLDRVTDEFVRCGFYSACCSCGEPQKQMSFYEINGKRDFICSDCHSRICQDVRQGHVHVGQEKSNLFTGFIGALAGIHIGLFFWMILSGLGFSGLIPSIVMMALMCAGYRFLGGCVDKKGVVLCVLLAMIYFILGNYLSMFHYMYVLYNSVQQISYLDAILLSIPTLLAATEETMAAGVVEIFVSFVFDVLILIIILRILYLDNKRGIVFREL